MSSNAVLSQLDFGASCFQLAFDVFGFCFVHAFFDLAASFNELFGFFEAQAGDAADFFDDVDFGCAGVLQNDVEFGFSSSAAASPPAGPAIITAPPTAGSMPYSSLRMVFSSCASSRSDQRCFPRVLSDQPLY